MAGTGAGSVVPPGDDAVWVAIRDLDRKLQELYALASGGKAIATAVQTGLGLLAGSGTTWAGPVASPSTVTAGSSMTATTSISAGTSVNGASLAITNAATVGGDVTSTSGTFWSNYALNNPVVSGYFALYVNGDGRFGRTVSARRYKQDISNFDPPAQAAFALQLRHYRLRQAVDEMGKNAPYETGLIAEELVDLGLGWLVQFGADGQAESIAYEKVALALIPAIQELGRVQADHEQRLNAAGI